MNGRVYDPLIGRFTSADPVTPEPFTVMQSWNRYAYVLNNPLKFQDPTGHAWTDNIPGWPGTASSGGTGISNDNTLTASLIAQGQSSTEKEQSTGVPGLSNDEPIEEIKVACAGVCTTGVLLLAGGAAVYAVTPSQEEIEETARAIKQGLSNARENINNLISQMTGKKINLKVKKEEVIPAENKGKIILVRIRIKKIVQMSGATRFHNGNLRIH